MPKFGFVISDLPVYSAKPQSGSVIYYDRKLQSSCVDGENICNGAMPVASSSSQMFAAESYARTTARPTTTTPKPTTTTKKMSLMELLQLLTLVKSLVLCPCGEKLLCIRMIMFSKKFCIYGEKSFLDT